MKTEFLLIALSCLIGFYSISNAQVPDTIKIGLLISDKKAPAALHGAEMAIHAANGQEGLKGHAFKIVARSMEGPWGTGSREAADLIFNEKVWAIIGSHDGRNAHIVEQVTTKAGLVFLSAWAADPTLSQAFTPWYFSCVPNNLQQADILINEIYNKGKFKNVTIVADKGYDSEQAVKSFNLRVQARGISTPRQLRFDNSTVLKNLTDEVININPGCIIFFGTPSQSVKIIDLLKEKIPGCPMFGGLSLLDENEFRGISLKNFEDVILLSPGHWFSQRGRAFSENYKALYNIAPGAVAAYAYDAVNLITEAIVASGYNVENLQKKVMASKYNGITGLIQFDERGNRKGPFQLVEIKNGNPALYKSLP